MNYKRFLILLLISGLLLTSCKGNTPAPSEAPAIAAETAAPKETPSSTVAEYAPFKPDTLYDYQGIGSEVAGQQIYNTYINGSVAQRYMLSGGGHRLMELLSLEGGQLSVIFGDVYNYYVEDLTTGDYPIQAILLREPLELGANWESDPFGGISEITNMTATVETPYGTFEAIEVSTLRDVNGAVFAEQSYYAKGVGLVKMLYGKEDSTTLGYELKSIESDASLSMPYYYFNPVVTDTDYDIIPEIRELKIKTNEDPAKVLTEEFKLSTDEAFRPVNGANARINSIVTDRDNNRITADFSKEFISEMNAGVGFEQKILQAVVNTLGNLYRVGEVRLTIDGQAYESGHIVMGQDEYMTVEMQEIQQ